MVIRRTTVACALILVVGCSPAPVEGVFFPTYPDEGGGPNAPVEGRLIEEGGCLWLERSDDQGGLLLWPSHAQLVEENGARVVRQDGFQAEVGQVMAATGGQYNHEDHYDFVVELIGQAIPAACRSDYYWLAFDAYTPEQ